MSKLIDLQNERFGKLTVIKRVDNKVYKNGRSTPQWLCQCNCGNKIIVAASNLRKGSTQSCGCLQKELLIKRNKTVKYTTHGQSRTRLYTIWCDMKQRCLNKNQKAFKHYGERRISICDEWKNNFNSFYDWAIRNGYTDNLTIDRIDVDGNYNPSNCRWTTMKQQRRNARSNVFVEINGVKKVLIDWCEYYKIKYTTVLSRIYSGWEMVKAITTPSRKYKEKLL